MFLSRPPALAHYRLWIGLALCCVLGACSSLKPPKEELPPPPKVATSALEPQDYLTKVDLARVKLGMNPAEVKNRIGPAMLGDPSPDRWDYVVKEGRGAAEQYNTWGVYFKDGKVVQIAQVENKQPPALLDATADALPPVDVANKSQEPPSTGKAMGSSKAASASKAKPDTSNQAALLKKQESTPALEGNANAQQEDPTAEIGGMLRSWVAAWSGKKVNTYLSFYASNFKHGMASRSAWVAQRRARLSQPGAIALDLSAIQVTLISPTQAEVKFMQRYKSENFTDQGKKRMVLVRQGGAWKIIEEAFEK